jgi:predicted ATPase
VAKSLITADVSGPVAVYRLLETTRAYGLGKLKEADELFQFARAHASYFLSWLDCAGADLDTNPEWPTTNGRQIDNVRTALDWAFSPGGDTELGVALTIAAAPLFIILSLVEECRSRAQLAFASLAPEARTDTREAMQLFAALGATMRYTRGSGAEIEAMWSKSLAIAERRGDIDYVLRALYGLCVIGLNNGRYHDALQLAYRFKAAAGNATDPNDVLVGDRMIGLALHNLGEQAQARRHIENLLGHYATGVHRSHIVRFGYDQRARAYNTHAVILWLQGLPDAAMRVVGESIAYIQAGHHELTLCNTLSHCACPVALFAGDLAAAQRYVGMLLDHSSTQGLAVWHAAGRCFDGVLRIKQGNVRDGVQALSAGIEALSEKRFAVRYLTFLAELADAYAQLGEMAQAQATVDEAVARCERNQELWYWPELLRVKGEVQLRAATLDPEAAEALFLKSLEFARRQASLAWELRAATSLAKLWSSLGRRDEARDRLQKVYGRFAEGFETSDLKAARRLLDELSIRGS